MKTTRRWLPWLAVAVVAIGFVNFFAFMVESLALGGDALNGREVNGHYFVASHGTYTEVAQSVWIISRIHAIVTLASWPFVMLSMAFLVLRYAFPFVMAGRSPGNAGPRVEAIRASGSPIWSGSPGGIAGGVRASIGMLQVAVHPAGIVANLRFSSPFAIRSDEIRSVGFGRRWGASRIEIDHAGIDVQSPLVLYGGRESPQAVAVSMLINRQRPAGLPEPPVGQAHDAPFAGGQSVAHAAARPKPPAPLRAMSVMGLLVGIVMLAIGLLWVIPNAGPFGFFWTGMIVVILAVNGWRFYRRGW